MSMSQKEAVYSAVKSIKSFDDGEKVNLTSDEKANVVNIVTESLASGDAVLSDKARAKFDTPTKLKSYTSGMVNNWMRKDTRLNGGLKYVIKNPGSRAGSQDDTIKNLKLLKSTLTDPAQIEECDAAIEARKAEITIEKAKNVEINYDHIPAELRESLGL